MIQPIGSDASRLTATLAARGITPAQAQRPAPAPKPVAQAKDVDGDYDGDTGTKGGLIDIDA